MLFRQVKMNGGLLLLKKVPPNLLLLLTDYPQGENGLWAPFDLLKCTSSANTDAIPDGWGPIVNVCIGPVFPGLFSLSWSLFQASFFNSVSVSVSFSSHILLT